MEREDGIIYFDDEDRECYEQLPPWAPIEEIPGIYEGIVEARGFALRDLQVAQGRDVYDVPEAERQTQIADAQARTKDLEKVRSELARQAAKEIAASEDIDDALKSIGGIDLTRLHEK